MEEEEVDVDLKEKIKEEQAKSFDKQFDLMSENMQSVLAQAWYLTRKSNLDRQQTLLLVGRCSDFIDKLLSVVRK